MEYSRCLLQPKEKSDSLNWIRASAATRLETQPPALPSRGPCSRDRGESRSRRPQGRLNVEEMIDLRFASIFRALCSLTAHSNRCKRTWNIARDIQVHGSLLAVVHDRPHLSASTPAHSRRVHHVLLDETPNGLATLADISEKGIGHQSLSSIHEEEMPSARERSRHRRSRKGRLADRGGSDVKGLVQDLRIDVPRRQPAQRESHSALRHVGHSSLSK